MYRVIESHKNIGLCIEKMTESMFVNSIHDSSSNYHNDDKKYSKNFGLSHKTVSIKIKDNNKENDFSEETLKNKTNDKEYNERESLLS